MKRILIVTNRPETFSRMADRLAAGGYETGWAGSEADAVAAVSGELPALILIDETVSGRTASDIARSVIMTNAMVNLAVVSPLSAEDFHDAFEGLGLLAQVSPHPENSDAENVITAISGIG